MKTIVDRSATFVPSCAHRLEFLERAGFHRGLAEGGTSVLYRRGTTGIKLSLEAGERELWVSRIDLVAGEPPPIFAWAPSHERRLAELEIKNTIEEALDAAALVVEEELRG
jgi:hypothetical protein